MRKASRKRAVTSEPRGLLSQVELPNLIEVQLNSFAWFGRQGLRELFDHFSPIEDFTGVLSMEFLDYGFGAPKYSPEECKDRDMTYEAPLKVKIRLVNKETGELKESEVYLGDVPWMTDKGTFIINGAERVVISQLSRSPGVYFRDTVDFSGRTLFSGQLIPREGAWVDFDADVGGAITVKIGQARRVSVTTLLRAFNAMPESYPHARQHEGVPGQASKLVGRILAEHVVDIATGECVAEAGTKIDAPLAQKIEQALKKESVLVVKRPLECGTTPQILELLGKRQKVPATVEAIAGKWTVADLHHPVLGRMALHAYQRIDRETAQKIEKLGLSQLEVLSVDRCVERSLEQDATQNEEAALLDINRKLRPGDPPTLAGARNLLHMYFFDVKRYDLGRVGRYKLNKKLGLDVPLDVHTLTKEDIIGIVRYLIVLNQGEGDVDDIDHLQNKRVRSVGELLQNQLRLGFLRMERMARERMTSMDREALTPQSIVSIKPITAAVKSFFGSGQLSQFMDQTNPLAELTNKRRISALGPGGLSRQSAKLEVRDVHHSHYGRICPIETPEGPNIGLIGSIASHARMNDLGFLETPYRKVIDGVVTNEVLFLTSEGEDELKIAPAHTPLDEQGRFLSPEVLVRYQSRFPTVTAKEVEYMDVAPTQLFSVATSLIPFLENDDANRALMGSNMQRQAVPLVRCQSPLVKTGIEHRVAVDSKAVVIAGLPGVVQEVSANRIIVEDYDGARATYPLQTFVRSNQATCIHQKPVVRKGQRVRKGQVIADGTSTDRGELALGRNLLVAFMLYEGLNYEDAIVLSERVTRDDLLTSLHIEKYEVEAKDTKLGPEEITRDIPNVGEDALRNLDANGVVRLGADVRAEDILVGKVAPKSQGELTAEERLVIAIFGKKAEEMRDASLKMPHGESGTVVRVQVFSRYKHHCQRCKLAFDFVRDANRSECEKCGSLLERQPGDELKPGTNRMVRVYVAQKRKVMVGDKLAGRHGNKGVISRILPEEDMPYLPDGTPVDILLNPLGVPSRMNIGQILEMHLGLVGHELGLYFEMPIFAGAREEEVLLGLKEVVEQRTQKILCRYITTELGLCVDRSFAGCNLEQTLEILTEVLDASSEQRLEELAEEVGVPLDTWKLARNTRQRSELLVGRIRENSAKRCGLLEAGKSTLYDGRTGEPFNQPVAIGYIYMMKLAHLVEDKIHARSTGPYSLVTQQPLGGKSQFGGQRFGEMEVWALEAYGAAYNLQEILTIKSDDVMGRVKTYESIVKGDSILEPGVPESFKILVKELQSLGLQVTVESKDGRAMELMRDSEEDATEFERHR